ncbi:MAG: hypothetical protein J5I41_12505 [Saprospiraceae bacterium]|nr:hypothetical protein [Saprospiraceae bacterium]
MMERVLLLTAFLLAVATGCTMKEPPTPSWHKDVFHCKVNGEEWKAQCVSDPLFGCSAVDCLFYPPSSGVEFSAIRMNYDQSINQSIGFSKYSTIIGDNEIQFRLRAYKDWNKPSGCRFHDLDTISVRRLTILEVDTVNFLIKGTFEFTAINNCQDTMRITDGYFHVNFRF